MSGPGPGIHITLTLMLDIGWSELLVVAVVAIVVIGPKDLPKLMRSFGHYAGKLRRAAADFQRQFEDAMAENEAEEVRKNIESIRSGLGPVDPNDPLNRPVMTPTPSSIEQAIPPGAEPKPPVPRTKKAAAKRKPTAKTATKAKTAKRRTTSKTKTGRKR